MRVSVVIPARNGEKYLAAAILSVLAQSAPAQEVVVVDDASTDSTGDLGTSSRWEGKVRYEYNEHPTGFADAWNRCAQKASGDYVAILHQDDILEPDFLKAMAGAHGQFPHVRHLFCAADYIDENGATVRSAEGRLPDGPFLWTGPGYASRYLHGVVSNQHLHRCPGVVTERRLLVEECAYRKEAGLIADDDFFYRVGMFTDVAGTGRPLAKFRLHRDSVSARTDLAPALARDYLFQTRCYAKETGPFSEEDRQALFGLAVRFINQALYEGLLRGDQEQAKTALSQRREMDRLLPGFMRPHLPAWSRLMWRLAGEGAPAALALAGTYAKAVHGAGAVRHLRKGGHGRAARRADG